MSTTTIPIIDKVTGRAIPLPGDEIDTDQIIPARYMRVITFDGLGEFAFYDERFDKDGSPKVHPLNDQRFKGGSILLAGTNFGCGSSREHAPQALKRFGINAIIGVSFADIFAGNCVAIGVVAVCVNKTTLENIGRVVESDPTTVVTIDLKSKKITATDLAVELTIPESSRKAFVNGLWDTTSVLISNKELITKTAQNLPYVDGYK